MSSSTCSHSGFPHYGRFTKVERPRRIEHTWCHRNTLGEESTVTLTFKKKGAGTLMTLLHSSLPDNALGKAHEEGWNYYLGIFHNQFGKKSSARAKR